MLLEEKIDRLLPERLGARIEIEREFAELPPSYRLKIDRQYPFAKAARRPGTRGGGLRGFVRYGFGGVGWPGYKKARSLRHCHAAFRACPFAGMSTMPHTHS